MRGYAWTSGTVLSSDELLSSDYLFYDLSGADFLLRSSTLEDAICGSTFLRHRCPFTARSLSSQHPTCMMLPGFHASSYAPSWVPHSRFSSALHEEQRVSFYPIHLHSCESGLHRFGYSLRFMMYEIGRAHV